VSEQGLFSGLAIDYAWQHPDPTAIAAVGYRAVLRYLSNDPSKDLSIAEAAALHAAGLGIGLVWETTATRATEGMQAGLDDMTAATAQAQALGYPPGLVIWLAVDTDVEWSAVAPYFIGASSLKGPYVLRPYGGIKIVEGFAAALGGGGAWQTEAWSGSSVSPNAALYQRVTPTLPPIPGAQGTYDEDAILQPIALWGPASSSSRKEDPMQLIPTTDPNAQPATFYSDPTVNDQIAITFDAIAPDGAPPVTCGLRAVVHKSDGSDAWVAATVLQGAANPTQLPNTNNVFEVTKGWAVRVQVPVGFDMVSLRNQGVDILYAEKL